MAAERRARAPVTAGNGSGNGHGRGRVVPEAPADFEAPARAIWEAVWALERIEAADASMVERLCRGEHEAARLRPLLRAEGEVLREPIIAPKGGWRSTSGLLWRRSTRATPPRRLAGRPRRPSSDAGSGSARSASYGCGSCRRVGCQPPDRTL